jgi:solute carrier family 25 thiamine pyrophosphate transporter 19
MYQKEGGRSLYKGLTPTLLQIFPHAGCQFGFYELFRKIWNLWKGHRQALKNNVGTSESLLCGASAGICSKAAVYPLDLIKKRFQVHGFEAGRASFGVVRQYNSLQHALQLIIMEEGLLGLYKGFLPSMMKVWLMCFSELHACILYCLCAFINCILLKAALSVGVAFSSYELTCNFMRTYKRWTPYVV